MVLSIVVVFYSLSQNTCRFCKIIKLFSEIPIKFLYVLNFVSVIYQYLLHLQIAFLQLLNINIYDLLNQRQNLSWVFYTSNRSLGVQLFMQ